MQLMDKVVKIIEDTKKSIEDKDLSIASYVEKIKVLNKEVESIEFSCEVLKSNNVPEATYQIFYHEIEDKKKRIENFEKNIISTNEEIQKKKMKLRIMREICEHPYNHVKTYENYHNGDHDYECLICGEASRSLQAGEKWNK